MNGGVQKAQERGRIGNLRLQKSQTRRALSMAEPDLLTQPLGLPPR